MNYFHADDPEPTFDYLEVPKSLFSEQYKGVSTGAKLLFSLMRDRALNGEKRVDPDGQAYINFPAREVMETLNVANEKATKMFKELEAAGLIERKRRYMGEPDNIYVRKIDW